MRSSRVASFDPDAMASFQAKYDTHGFICKGAYGQVWRCTERATGREFACKVVQRTEGEDLFPSQLVSLRNEAYVLQKLLGNCQGFVEAHDAIMTSDSMHLVMELCQGGDLQRLISSRGALPEASARLVFFQLASALQQLHSRNLVHRDIKPGNILLDRDATCLYYHSQNQTANNSPSNSNTAAWDVQAKLGDLGMAAVLAPGELASADVGTRGYEAPEILRGAPYGAAVDVWSLGAVLCVLLTGKLPFRRDPADALGHRMAVLRGHVDFSRPCWGGVPEDARDLVRRMLRAEPGRRPTAEELLRHPWCATHVSTTAAPAPAAFPATQSTVPASVKPVQGPFASSAVLNFPGGSMTTQREDAAGDLGQQGAIEGGAQASGPTGKGQGRKLRWLQRLAVFSRN